MKNILVQYLWIFLITAGLLAVTLLLLPEKKNRLEFIEEEIIFLIQLKYNFIHYNGFPEVDKVNFRERLDKDIFKGKIVSFVKNCFPNQLPK